MVKKLKTFLVSTIAALSLAMPLAAPVAVYAAVTQEDISGSVSCGTQFNVSTEPCTVDDPGAENRINDIVRTGINIFSVIVGIVAVVFIIIGGLKYITSGGEANNVKTAKDTILFAIVGLIIVALAQIIVRFVLSKAAG